MSLQISEILLYYYPNQAMQVMKQVFGLIDYISNIRTIHEPFLKFLNIITQNHLKISWSLGLKLKYQS